MFQLRYFPADGDVKINAMYEMPEAIDLSSITVSYTNEGLNYGGIMFTGVSTLKRLDKLINARRISRYKCHVTSRLCNVFLIRFPRMSILSFHIESCSALRLWNQLLLVTRPL